MLVPDNILGSRRDDDAAVLADRDPAEFRLDAPLDRCADRVVRAVGDSGDKGYADKIVLADAGHGKVRRLRSRDRDPRGRGFGKGGCDALVGNDAADRIAAVRRRHLDAVYGERSKLIAVVGLHGDDGAVAAADGRLGHADTAVFIGGLRADGKAGQPYLGDGRARIDVIKRPFVRRIDLAERGDIRDLLLDERRAVGARAVPLAELIDVVNKAFRLGIDVGFQTEEALLPGAGADVDQGAVARQLIGERIGAVFGAHVGRGRVKADRAVAITRPGNNDRVSGARDRQAHLRLDADKIGRAAGVDRDPGLGIVCHIKRAVAGEGDAAAPAHRFRTDGREGAAAAQADLEVAAHHRQRKHGGGGGEVRERERVAHGVIAHAVGQQITRLGILVGIEDLLLDRAVGGVDRFVHPAREADRRAYVARNAGAVCRKGAGRCQAGKQYDA